MKKIVCMALALVMILAMTIPAMAANFEDLDFNSVQVFDCDTKPNGSNSLTVDKAEKTEGEASLTFNTGSGVVNEMKLSSAVDCTDMDTLEFDLYVSNVSLFDLFGVVGKMDNGFEICSSGKNDNQEISWTLEGIRNNHRGEALKEGWNHIILPLNTGKADAGTDAQVQGPFDPSNVNYLRFYMVGEVLAYDITVKIDNICLTDWNAVTTAVQKEELAMKKANEFIAAVETVEVTAENYTTIKADVEALRKQYNKLNDIAKDYVTKAALDKLVEAETKIADFEANPPSDEPLDEQSPVDGQPPVEEPKSGCGATVALGGVAILALAGAMMLKRKED